MSSIHDEAERVLEKVLGVEGPERQGVLSQACGGNSELQRQVETLLQAHEEADSFMDSVTQVDDSVADENAGTRIGRYKLLEKLGEGGFGSVWAAEQREPVKRRVALKIIKLGMDTKQVVARFEAERQALAMMDHLNIAKVLDAGTTDSGRPYFVMELVKGIPITKFFQQEGAAVGARLRLFIRVCHAIQHAHQKGIIHRDIKPSNVMVTLHDGEPVPKVIDFGIAKATQGELTDKTVYTQYSQFIGTPAYMSPEQAEMSGLDIDTRSDVYSLGVLLYEILTGSTPFDSKELMASGIDEMRKIIRERDPVKPSTRLSQSVESATAVEGRRVVPLRLSSDLDWIVLKCLEKDRSRRYDTVNALSMDIQRHLHDEPILARSPTLGYRFQKAWKKHKLVYGAVSAVILTLGLGLSLSVWQWTVADRAREDAKKAERTMDEERQVAVLNAQRAEDEKVRADQAARKARLHEYIASISLAHRFLLEGNIGPGRQLLRGAIPTGKDEDFRGFEWRYLGTQYAKENPIVLEGHSREVTDVAFAPQGSVLASGAKEGTIILWDTVQRAEYARWSSGHRGISSLSFSRDGKRLASMGLDLESDGSTALVKLWDLSTNPPELIGEPLVSEFGGYNGRIMETQNVAFSPSEAVLAYQLPEPQYGVPSDIELFNYENRSSLVLPDAGSIFCFSPDGVFIASGAVVGDSSFIKIWDARSGSMLHLLENVSDLACEFVWHEDRFRIATNKGKELHLWDPGEGRRERVVRRANEEIYGIRASSDRLHVALADYSRIQVLSLPDFLPVETFSAQGGVVHDLEFSPDGRLIAYYSQENVIIRALRTKNTDDMIDGVQFAKSIVRTTPSPMSADDRYMALRKDKSRTIVVDLKTMRIAASIDRDVYPAVFSEDGARVVLIQQPGDVHQLDGVTLCSGNLQILKWRWQDRDESIDRVASFDVENLLEGGGTFLLEPGGGYLGLTISDGPDELSLLVIDLNRLQTHKIEGMLNFPAVSPSGLIMGDWSYQNRRTRMVWNAEDWSIVSQREVPFRPTGYRYHSFGESSFIGEGGITSKANIHRLENNYAVENFDLGVDRLYAVDVSPDGKTLASSGSGSVLQFWNVETGRQLLSLSVEQEVGGLEFSPGGSLLVTKDQNRFRSAQDTQVRVYRTLTNEEIEEELRRR